MIETYLTVKELITILSGMNPDKKVMFDTEAARFNVHLIPISSVYEEGPECFDLVILSSDSERQH